MCNLDANRVAIERGKATVDRQENLEPRDPDAPPHLLKITLEDSLQLGDSFLGDSSGILSPLATSVITGRHKLFHSSRLEFL